MPVRVAFEQLHSHCIVRRGQSVLDGLTHHACLRVPAGGPPVKLGGLLFLESVLQVAQQVGKQVMVSIPLPFVIQGYQKQVGAQQSFQHEMTVCTSGHRVAQITVQLVQDRRLQQETLHVIRLPAEDLLGQIAQYVAVTTTEGGDEAGWVGPVAQT